MNKPVMSDEVDFVSGKTRLFGIVGHPIEQVRSPEMVSAEFQKRGHPGIMLPFHVLPETFDEVLPALMKMPNLDGLIFTIPFKGQAAALASRLGTQASVVGAINALGRNADGEWIGEIFDGLGCVEGFRRRGYGFAGKNVMLVGTGGAGSAIGVAVAFEGPASIRVFDPDTARADAMKRKIVSVNSAIEVTIGAPTVEGMDIVLNASPVGMLDDPRRPIEIDKFPGHVIVFDAIVKPERTRFLATAEDSGCRTVYGREMMRGQIAKLVDFFSSPSV